MKKKILAILLVFSLLLVASCSNGGTEEEQGKNEGNKNSKEGGTLIFGRGADAISLDPIAVTDGESIKSTLNVYETLFIYNNDLELEPQLATDYKVSEDGLTWTFPLKQGVKFHDGTDFNADAVVFNFERWMDQDNPYHNGDFVYYSFLYGGFKGDENHLIEYVKKADDYTVEIKLKEKTAPFLSYLAIPMFGMASPTAIEKYGDEYAKNPVGTGPFKFESWKENDKITLVKNEDYHVEGLPYLDSLIFSVIPDNSARMTALQSGAVDLIDGLNPDDMNIVEKNEELVGIKRPSFNIGYMAFNTEKKPFDNLKVRQAINMAIDKQGIIDAFYNGMGEVAKNPLPSSLWGYNDTIKDYEYNTEEAKKLLTEAGFPDGFKTTLFAMSNPRPYMPQPLKIAEAIQSDLGKIGIEVEVESYEWATYLEKTQNGEHDMGLYGWTGIMADPDNFLYPNLSKENTKKPANNIAFYKNDAFHDLLVKARRTIDQEERIKIYKEAQEIFHADAPWALLGHTTPPLASAVYVKDYVPHPMTNDLFTEVYLDK